MTIHTPGRSFLFAATIFVVSTATLAAQQDSIPPPPDGFVWKEMEYVSGRLLIPEDWHWKVERGQQSMNYFASVEDIDVSGVFKTGMSIWVIRLDEGRDAADFGRRWVAELAKHGTVLDTSSNSTPPFRSTACRIRNTEAPDHKPVILQNTAIVNTQTSTIYLVVFESPEETWAEAWKNGKAMFSGMSLNPRK